MKNRTRVNHPPAAPIAGDNRPLVAPIHQSVKFTLDTIAECERLFRGEREGYYYTRTSNPTTRQLERLLAELQGREDCICVGSGVAAVSATLFALLKAGDHVLCFAESYGPSRHFLRRMLGRYGVTHTLLSIEDDAGIERLLATQPTRLVLFESPTNPILKIADIARLTRAARAAGAVTVMDNTFAGFHNHGQYDIDVFVHSLTKFAGGHSDVMGGAIIASAERIKAMRYEVSTLGPVLDPHAAFLTLRGMRTYYLRYEAQSAAAARIAAWLERHPAVARVHHPGLPSHPRHDLARAQQHDFGSVIAFDLEDGPGGGMEPGRRFTEALRLFANTASIGSVESLVMPPQFLQPREIPAELRAATGIGPGTVRLSIGIEDTDDLLADLGQALAAAAAG